MTPDSLLSVPPTGPDCAAFAPLLPLAGQRLLEERDAARLHEHLAGCNHCLALLSAYDRLDAALVRHVDRHVKGIEGLTEAIMEHIEDQQNPLPSPDTAESPALPPPPPRGRRGLITSAGALAAFLAIAVGTATLFAGHGLHLGTHGLGSANLPPLTPTARGPQLTVNDVALVSPTDGWAFAQYSTAACFEPPHGDPRTPQLTPPSQSSNCKTTNLMLHYDGRSWTIASTVSFTLVGTLTMASAREGWALGLEDGRYEVVRYSGAGWRVDHAYDFPVTPKGSYSSLESLAMVSATEGWAVGYQSSPNDNPALLLHYTQGHWVPVAVPGSPSVADLHSISILNGNEGWAVGVAFEGSDQMVLVEHYHNGAWSRVELGLGSLNGVYAVSPDEAWMVGSVNPSFGPGLILHYKAGTWTREGSLQFNILHAVTMVSPTEGWAVGDGAMLLRYTNGIWSQVGQPIHHFMLTGVSMGSATDGWAVGYYRNDNPRDGKNLFHYTGGKWSPYSLATLASQLSER